MNRTMKQAGVLVLASALLAGCAVFASKSDYASYREVRMADDERAQLVAMQRYMAEHPEGSWSEEIQQQRIELGSVPFHAKPAPKMETCVPPWWSPWSGRTLASDGNKPAPRCQPGCADSAESARSVTAGMRLFFVPDFVDSTRGPP